MNPQSPSEQPPHAGTYLETNEDVMKSMRDRLLRSAGAPLPRPDLPPTVGPKTSLTPAAAPPPGRPAGLVLPGPVPPSLVPGTGEVIGSRSSAQPYRPLIRPPMPLLTVFDDGKPDGEIIRIRGTRFVIGRTEGHLKFPTDNQISSRHVEIALQDRNGAKRWIVTDLSSTNGTYARVTRAALADRAEFAVGAGFFRLDFPTSGHAATIDHLPSRARPDATLAPGEAQATFGVPKLVELVRGAVFAQWSLLQPEYWIGSDPACTMARPNDPFCEPKHARLFSDSHGAWHVENNLSLNGVWLRVPHIVVTGTAYFQIGEQRFKLQVGE